MIRYQTAPPSIIPISITQAKAQSRVLFDADDESIDGYLRAALDYMERVCGRSFASSEWEVVLDAFPTSCIDLAPVPVSAVGSVIYADIDGVPATMPPADYYWTADGRLSFVTAWPPAATVNGAVKVRYTTGGGVIPPSARHAVLLIAAHWYEHRETAGPSMAEIPFGADALMRSFRIMSI